MAQVLFWLMAIIAVLGGLGVVLSRQPIRSVLSLVATMLALSILFLMLSAQFVFAVQIIIYAGAVMVLFLFVVALLGPIKETGAGRLRLHWGYTLIVTVPFFAGAWVLLRGAHLRPPRSFHLVGSVEDIGFGLFTTYLYPFELTSLLLLVAAVGAIYLSRGGSSARELRRLEDEASMRAEAELAAKRSEQERELEAAQRD
ncbi:MAG: NADH-quinone oxidoreductase subunit J [Candidatus Dormibacteraeota bacterium]|nr:NADH-quinone oxidoreductase subunit J [Candidatus Dormibacteraeota bacterium]